MDVEDGAITTKLVVTTAKIDMTDTDLAQRKRAHNAGFDSDVQIRLGKDRLVVLRQDQIDRLNLGMPCGLGHEFDLTTIVLPFFTLYYSRYGFRWGDYDPLPRQFRSCARRHSPQALRGYRTLPVQPAVLLS